MTDYIKLGNIPPANPDDLATPSEIANSLQKLIGTHFSLSGKTRTDGNKFRKLITETLMKDNPPIPANLEDFNILPPKSKGVPKFLRQFIDTYIVTSGDNYNLQVWNRNPNSNFIQVEYVNQNKNLTANDVTFVFGKINTDTEVIDSIIVTTPQKIVEKFGRFGVPTSKQQLIISDLQRSEIINSPDHYLYYPDSDDLSSLVNPIQDTSLLDLKSYDVIEILPLSIILDKIKDIIGITLTESSTKLRGQELEKIVASKLGYSIPPNMEGGYPDLPNQVLEIKVQDSPTVDLGRYSPQSIENIEKYSELFNTSNIRYLIAFTNAESNQIEGFYLGPGNMLGQHFSYVSETSVKYQRNISMSFFEGYSGQSVAI
ncbi:TPA: hypothetical protein TZN96_002161 [Streptococcus suis]|nr:hypothetical protein [Streptococcus suis]HEL2326961.1 hypothetical protein [Streptococcus suis]